MPDTPDVPDVAAVLRARVAELEAENAELRALVAGQAERIARLERLISRNSGNSSMPPSTDDLPGRKPPRPRPDGGGKRRAGKQPGAPGAYLAWNPDPDIRIGHFPQGCCACGADLGSAMDLGVAYSYQVTDLPEVRAQTIQHDRHAVRCGCGRGHTAPAPTVTVAVVGESVRVEVTDRIGKGIPVLPPAAPAGDEAEGSRGLWLVDALSARWGYQRGGGLATTWFELGTAADSA